MTKRMFAAQFAKTALMEKELLLTFLHAVFFCHGPHQTYRFPIAAKIP